MRTAKLWRRLFADGLAASLALSCAKTAVEEPTPGDSSSTETYGGGGGGGATSRSPEAMIFSAPSGESSVTVLAVDISGTGVTHYKYKLASGGSEICADSSDYQGEFSVDVRITAGFSALADGPVTLCVVGRDVSETWQDFADATFESWTKVSPAPASVSFTGAPSGTSALTSFALNVSPSGGSIAAYKFKVVSGTSCAGSAGYSAEMTAGVLSTVDLAAIPDGTTSICVIARSNGSAWMDPADASLGTWIKDTSSSSGVTCNPGYYPVSSTCTAVGAGYYSNDGQFRNACANTLPAHATWTSTTASSANCPWFCSGGYTGSSLDGSTGCAAVSGAGVLVAAGGAVDDQSRELNACSGGVSGTCGVPFPFYFNNVNYGNRQNGGIFWSSNNYINFGFGSAQYSGFNAASPGRGIYMNARDNMMTFLYVATDTPNSIRRFSMTYEGYQYGHASNTTQNIKVEMFAMGTNGQILPQTSGKCYNGGAWSDCSQVVNILYGVQMATTGVSAISNGSSYINVYGLPTTATYTSSGSGPYTVTVTSSAHGFSSGQQVTFTNGSSANANGTYSITRLSGDAFSYSVNANPGNGTVSYTVSPYTTSTTIPIAANLSFSLSSEATGTYWTKSRYVYKALDGFVLP